MSEVLEAISVRFAGLARVGSIPAWAAEYNAERVKAADIVEEEELPGVIVLRAGTLKELSSYQAVVEQISARVREEPQCRVVVNVPKTKATKPEGFAQILSLFPGAVDHVDIAVGAEQLQTSFYESLAKCQALTEERAHDPLAGAREVVAATRPLRAKSGRLSAKAVAGFFGMSLSKLAESIGRSKQALSKTPDAPKVQLLLRPFERIARLRATLPEADFLAWLRQENRELDGAAPLDLIEAGQAEIVADLAEDMLLGTPA